MFLWVFLLLMMILDDIPFFKLVFLLSFLIENSHVTSVILSVDPMELFNLVNFFACQINFILFFRSFNYYFDCLMLLICYEIYYFIIIIMSRLNLFVLCEEMKKLHVFHFYPAVFYHLYFFNDVYFLLYYQLF